MLLCWIKDFGRRYGLTFDRLGIRHLTASVRISTTRTPSIHSLLQSSRDAGSSHPIRRNAELATLRDPRGLVISAELYFVIPKVETSVASDAQPTQYVTSVSML